MRWVPYALAAIGVALAFLLSGCSAAPSRVVFTQVDDRPLLETLEQVREARLTGRCAVRIGSEYYVLENVPKEYVDYSAWRVRFE